MHERFTIHKLPVAAKLVLTCFLFSVGVGYFSALVQLHLQHSNRDGNPLPTPSDVIERFSGLKKYDASAPAPKSKIEALISGPKDSGWGKGNMTPAFFEKSGSAYAKDCAERTKKVVDEERDGERKAMIAWIQSEPGTRKSTYDGDAYPYVLPIESAISEDFYNKEKKTVPIKTLIETRCAKCHNGDQKPDLDDFAKIEPLITPPSAEVLPGGWVRSPKLISIEGLTQSTHAHLLSFSILYMLTGLIFSLTRYPGIMRATIGPIVLIAQVADISCWWLARLPDVGPMFAQTIIITGGIVGVGLASQIVLSVFDMFGRTGRVVLLALFAGAAVGFGSLYIQVIQPNLAKEKLEAAKQ